MREHPTEPLETPAALTHDDIADMFRQMLEAVQALQGGAE